MKIILKTIFKDNKSRFYDIHLLVDDKKVMSYLDFDKGSIYDRVDGFLSALNFLKIDFSFDTIEVYENNNS